MPDPVQRAAALIERQLAMTVHRDVFTAQEVQDNLFEIYAALELNSQSEPETVTA